MIVFVIPYISLLLKDCIKSETHAYYYKTTEEDINIYKNKYEKEIVEYDYDYIIDPKCGYEWELINYKYNFKIIF